MRPRTTLLYLCLCIITLACTTTPREQIFTQADVTTGEIIADKTAKLDSAATGLRFKPFNSYAGDKKDIEDYRLSAKERYLRLGTAQEKNAYLDTVMLEFTSRLLNQIIPHWYGTEWDYNGHTETPGDGLIACGYFVSTTLRDMGVKLNRYKLAQQGGWNEARSLAVDHSAVTSHRDTDGRLTMESLFKDYKDGLYFVGLDNHVGYVYLKDNQAYFLNSNYIVDYVLIELAEESAAFRSEIYVLAPITHNRELARKWIMGEQVDVVMDY